MKEFTIISKTFGIHIIKLDDLDYDRIISLGGKWCLAFKRGKYYPQKRIKGKIIEMHRYIIDPPSNMYVDHINHNTLDNRRENLRVCTNSSNLRNASKRIDNKSGETGVFYLEKTNKWVSYIKVRYKRIHLGLFDKFEDAVIARKEAEVKYWSI